MPFGSGNVHCVKGAGNDRSRCKGNGAGPIWIVLMDTAGLNDETVLGKKRTEKSMSVLERADLALYAADISSFDRDTYESMKNKFEKYTIPHILVFTKRDTAASGKQKELRAEYPGAFFTEVGDVQSLTALKNAIGEELKKAGTEDVTLVGDLVPPGGVVLCVIPLDSAAPKGRLILPGSGYQDCLDHGITCCCEDTELESAMKINPASTLLSPTPRFLRGDSTCQRMFL